MGARARPHRASGPGGDLTPELPGLLRKWVAGHTCASASWPWAHEDLDGWARAGAEAACRASARTRSKRPPPASSVPGSLTCHLIQWSQGSCELDIIFIPILGPRRLGRLVPGHTGCGYRGEAQTWPQTVQSKLKDPTSRPWLPLTRLGLEGVLGLRPGEGAGGQRRGECPERMRDR